MKKIVYKAIKVIFLIISSIGITLASIRFSIKGWEISYVGGGTPSGWPFAYKGICTSRFCPPTQWPFGPFGHIIPYDNLIFWLDVIFWFLVLVFAWFLYLKFLKVIKQKK